MPTLTKVLQTVNNDENLLNFKHTNFWKLLKELNFTFISRHRNNVLIERDDLILWRELPQSCEKIPRRRSSHILPGRNLNEADDVSTKVWIDTIVKFKKDAFLLGLSTGPSNPTGKGKRLIVLHIGSTAGFVSDGLLCFESKKNTANYHDEINGDTFLE